MKIKIKTKTLVIAAVISIILIIVVDTFPSGQKNKAITTEPVSTPGINTITLPGTQNQTPDDYKFDQGMENLFQQYPWYSKIPIETKDYRIIYDFDKNSFRIRLLTTSTDVIKQSAINSLKAIGVDLNKFTYYFIEPETTPQPTIAP